MTNESTQPTVSICIPAYENVEFLKRLLDSIAIQNYPKIEIVVSDDSLSDDVKNIIPAYANKLIIKYSKNTPALRTPGNWNKALDNASGELLMLVHHDDWLNEPLVISKYVEAFQTDPSISFAFCRSMAFSDSNPKSVRARHSEILHDLYSHPEKLLLGNVIGPPSNVMVRKNVPVRYTEPFIWIVDVEYYMQLLEQGLKYRFIDEPLISVGLHEQQTTAYVQQNTVIILKEHLLLASKHGTQIFSDWRIYDLYWRLLRNHNIRNVSDLQKLSIDINPLPPVIEKMISTQGKIPSGILKTGAFSKIFMWMNYLSGRS